MANITLNEMDDAQFNAYVPFVKDLFAQIVINCGVALQRATSYSQKAIDAILEQGRETQGHYFFVAHKDKETIGHLWLALETDKLNMRRVFIYMVDVLPEHRYNGYAMEMLKFANGFRE